MMSTATATVTTAAATATTAATAAAATAATATTAVTVLSVACVALAVALALMCAVDVPYFLRTLCSYARATWLTRPLRVTDAATYRSACLTSDVDVYLSHMNNARYLREVDLARVEFVLRTGLWRELRARGGLMFTIANSVRYRKFVRTFARYEIRTRLVYWDDETLFFEYRFVTRTDGFVRAVVYNRQKVVGCGVDELLRATLAGHDGVGGGGGGGGRADGDGKTADGSAAAAAVRRPECPIEIHYWIQSNLMSSANLKAESGYTGGGGGGGVTATNSAVAAGEP